MKKSVLFVLLLLLALTSCTAVTPHVETSASTGTNEIETGTESSVPVETTPETQTELSTQEEMTEANTKPNEPTVTIPNGSFSTDTYAVSQINNTYYWNFFDGNTPVPGDDSYLSITDSCLYFDSLADMKEKIISNALTQREIATIKKTFPKDENGILMFNVHNLYQATAPTGYTFPQVLWEGDTYGGLLGSQGSQNELLDAWGYWRILSDEQYDAKHASVFEKYIQDYQTNESKSIISHEISQYEGLPCEIYDLQTSLARLRVIWFNIPKEEGEEPLHISLSYTIDYSGSSENVGISETIPYRGYIFGTSEGQYYQITLHDFTTAPTVEWLSSFGITPCVGTSDQVVS